MQKACTQPGSQNGHSGGLCLCERSGGNVCVSAGQYKARFKSEFLSLRAQTSARGGVGDVGNNTGVAGAVGAAGAACNAVDTGDTLGESDTHELVVGYLGGAVNTGEEIRKCPLNVLLAMSVFFSVKPVTV